MMFTAAMTHLYAVEKMPLRRKEESEGTYEGCILRFVLQ